MLLILIAQLSISHQSNQVTVQWTGNWLLQSSTNLTTWQTEAATNFYTEPIDRLKFFRLAGSTNVPICVLHNGQTNDCIMPVGSNQFRSYVKLIAVTEPLPSNPTFMVRAGQAHLHPPLFTDTGILRESESRGIYDNGGYYVMVETQDPITTPLVIRVIGGTPEQPYLAYARFTNP